MIPRLEAMKERVRAGTHHPYRQNRTIDVRAEVEQAGLSPTRAAALVTVRMCDAEQPVILPDERIVFTRTLPHPPYPFSDELLGTTKGTQFAYVCNVCADWGMALDQGLIGRKQVALATRRRLHDDPEAVEFLDAAIETIDAALRLVGRYADEARRLGRHDVAELLEQVPAYQPRSFHEALQSLRFLQALPWLSGHNHVVFGRFDQYLWPYLRADLDAGRLTLAQAEELLAEFFIALNKDSDLYPGVQQGDNGQSIMLGGVTPDGQDAVNPLTWLVLRVSHDVNMIDPKINLRVSANTPLDLLTEAVKLTRRGLGFPQYSNDDVVIPGLIAHGYAPEDARNYTVAACWEFIIPGRGMEVPNINALSFPAAADAGIRAGLLAGDDFAGILERTRQNIRQQVQRYVAAKRAMTFRPPAPFFSVLMTDCLEQGKDANNGGARYYNYGIHGSGAANASDALAVVRQLVFAEQRVSGRDLVRALETDFEDDEALRQLFLTGAPRVGNDDDEADGLMAQLFEWFADACEEIQDNGRGGIVRPGTGTAMYYVWLVKDRGQKMLEPIVGATADGRKVGDYISCSLAPSPGVQVNGPISVLQSFSKINYRRIVNGGPITMELSDTVFRGDESLRKVAMLVRTFAQVGCQQLQLNVLNVETLQDAKLHPENHRNLIVRVWGWSGYFCELAPDYQDHIIARHMYALA